ncbi:AraC family transcriptional regulator [Bradyrhizobium sp. Pear77]|uniref:helix-turn-helix domain-containing protein n=1 Tax=Bradyrhizobium altum TaxID=1571202 RepID=UPI001E566487|nr:helix-turn-helix domain-containing protein [Bradyrhizobium altum]MCC8955410.1 AraC family transcriptional regulator [Bradyrhizobium altum]
MDLNDFGQYTDAIQGATVTFLKSAPSSHRWGVRHLTLNRTILQFGADGGPGIVHGVTEPTFATLIMQSSNFDDRVLLDGAPCQASDLVIFPPDCHFTFVRSGHVEWVAWSLPREESIARKILPAATNQDSPKTAKHLVRLPEPIASRLIKASRQALRSICNCVPADRPTLARDVERALMDELAYVWDNRLSETVLPNKHTVSSERIVLEALQFVRARSTEFINITDIVKVTKVEYRTLLRAFERYLGYSPKHYLKLRQLNLVYHEIRRENGASARTADILAAHGVTEFGRFAGQYRSLFGELPSETHRRLRALESGNSL